MFVGKRQVRDATQGARQQRPWGRCEDVRYIEQTVQKGLVVSLGRQFDEDSVCEGKRQVGSGRVQIQYT